jgi:hypothetical protein
LSGLGARNQQFRVLYPEVVRQALPTLLEQARGLGIEAEVAVSVKVIDERLRADPRAYGDVYNHLQRWTKYVRVQAPLFVRYAVSNFLHGDSYLVYVSAIEPLSGHGL